MANKAREGEGFRIWEVGIDGTGLRQLTFAPEDEAQRIETYRMDGHHKHWAGKTYYRHHTDDMHPTYLPDEGFVFVSTRCEFSILCDGPDDQCPKKQFVPVRSIYTQTANGLSKDFRRQGSVKHGMPSGSGNRPQGPSLAFRACCFLS